MRWFMSQLPERGVTIRNISDETPALALIGPDSRGLLERLSGSDCSNEALPLMALRQMEVALAPACVVRMSISGELGYEIHANSAYVAAIYHAAKRLGARDIGFRAILSMRLEKSFGIWGREYSPDYSPGMAGMDRFIDYGRDGFIGRDAALAERDRPASRRLALFRVDASDSDANGFEPIWAADRLVGFVTSGGYGHRVGESLALGYIDRDIVPDSSLTTELLGERRSVTLLDVPAYDPTGARMRG
jgi:dimethylglycine dehydrogenase